MGAAVRVLWTVPVAALVSAALLPVLGGGLPEVAFGTFMIGGFLMVLQLAAGGWRATHREASRARGLARTSPDELARAAVAEERRRLSVDLEATIREALVRVLHEADPVRLESRGASALRRVQHEARAAASDLRRELGLLRPVQGPVGATTVTAASAALLGSGTGPEQRSDPTAPSRVATRARPAAPSRADTLIGVGASLLAVVEVPFYEQVGDLVTASLPTTMLLTSLAAGTLTWRRTAPEAAASVCAGLFLVGWAIGSQVSVGLWYVATVGSLLWTLAARSRMLGTGGCALVLLTSVTLLIRAVESPANLAAGVVIDGAAIAGGLVVRLLTRRRLRAESAAAVRESELQRAVDLAVHAERTSMARELHDVVSHAVGLVAVQAAAAEVTWETDRPAALRAMDLVRVTADETLVELDRLLPGDRTTAKTPADVEALAERIRAAGTGVTLELTGTPDPASMRVVHRVVQEALTNVVRHAAGARATVRVEAGATGTVVDVHDDGPGAVGSTSRGYGLVGLGERVALAGGTLATGPGPDGRGFRVRAVLPLRTVEVVA